MTTCFCKSKTFAKLKKNFRLVSALCRKAKNQNVGGTWSLDEIVWQAILLYIFNRSITDMYISIIRISIHIIIHIRVKDIFNSIADICHWIEDIFSSNYG